MAVDIRNIGERLRAVNDGEIPPLWKEPKVGEVEFNFMVEQGLKPCHKLLEIGCGPLRAGVHFIGFLENDNYYGVDKSGLCFVWGNIALGLLEINKHWNFMCSGDFDFTSFGTRFDYVFAGSVFTHLPSHAIYSCLMNVKHVLKQDGEFFATYFEIESKPPKVGANLFRYDVDTMIGLAERAGMSIDFIGEFGHPNKRQLMLRYEKTT